MGSFQARLGVEVIQSQAKQHLTLLHLPTTSGLLALIVIGASAPPFPKLEPLLWLLLEGFLMIGVASNYFDEIRGRPWRTTIPEGVLWAAALGGYLSSTTIGVYLATTVGSWFLVFVAAWCFLVPAYSLELFSGLLHNEWNIGLTAILSSISSALIQSPVLTLPRLFITILCGVIASQGRRLYEAGKAAGKDRSGDPAAREHWQRMSLGILLIDAIAIILIAKTVYR